MKKLVVVIFLGLLSAATVQSQNIEEQSGMATQEMTDEGLVAAHSSLLIGSHARVTNPDNGKEVVVRITRRINKSQSRVIDLSPDAAQSLGLGSGGWVNINPIPRARRPPPPPEPPPEPPPPQEKPSITIVNNTGEPINAFYIRYAGSDWARYAWPNNRIIASGESFPFTLPNLLSAVSRYDIRLKKPNGRTYTKNNVTVSDGGRIEFTITDSD
jgi:hypothetical protein